MFCCCSCTHQNPNHRKHPNCSTTASQHSFLQGLHEIAGVLLLQVGQNVSYHLLVQLAQGHLRDSTRQSLDAVIESLQLLYSILKAADAELADHIMATGIEPFFAISWVITWFAHHVSPDLVARLFDLFIASHPLMPVYLYVEGMREVRTRQSQAACQLHWKRVAVRTMLHSSTWTLLVRACL